MSNGKKHDDAIPEAYAPPHIHAGQDFQTKATVQLEYIVKELERQGRILGNGTGMISDVRWMKDWIRTRAKIEWIVVATLLGAAVLWACQLIWKVAKL